MITAEQRSELETEFQELADPHIILAKEVYAHFGLLFFKFSLVEHSLINALTFHHVGQQLAARRIRTKEDWEQASDDGYNNARQKTFGNLVRTVSNIVEFVPFIERLSALKDHRDYFAHHFFRDDIGIYMSDEGSWHVLYEIKRLREQLLAVDKELSLATGEMSERFGLPRPSQETLERAELELRKEADARIATGHPFCWPNRAKSST